jgi:hypothetical protein
MVVTVVVLHVLTKLMNVMRLMAHLMHFMLLVILNVLIRMPMMTVVLMIVATLLGRMIVYVLANGTRYVQLAEKHIQILAMQSVKMQRLIIPVNAVLQGM